MGFNLLIAGLPKASVAPLALALFDRSLFMSPQYNHEPCQEFFRHILTPFTALLHVTP